MMKLKILCTDLLEIFLEMIHLLSTADLVLKRTIDGHVFKN